MVGTLHVVDKDAEVRLAWERGERAVTRDSLNALLLSALAPEVVLATPLHVRLVLSDVLEELGTTEAWLGVFAARGGHAWVELVSAVLVSLTEARRWSLCSPVAEGDDAGTLEDPRARILFTAGRALDATLGRHGLVDPTAVSDVVARALARASTDAIVSCLRAN